MPKLGLGYFYHTALQNSAFLRVTHLIIPSINKNKIILNTL